MTEVPANARPITVDELRPFFVGHEAILDLALVRFHHAVEQQKNAMLLERIEALEAEVITLDPADDDDDADEVIVLADLPDDGDDLGQD